MTCNICESGSHFSSSRDVARIPSNVRRFRQEVFTVWRCPDCGSLHCLEDIDYGRYYDGYFAQREKMDFFWRRLFSSRLRQLKSAGLTRRHSILDFGCGNGNFVRFLQNRRYSAAEGYDPFSQAFSDRSVCARRYDIVACQDVIEHAPDPIEFLDNLARTVKRPGGKLAIGTPNAEHIDLHDPLDNIMEWLHQPFHRHILTSAQLIKLVERRGFRIDQFVPRIYMDTWWPFLNSRFILYYFAAMDGTIDNAIDPIQYRLILRSPKLLFYGLFGRLLCTKSGMFVAATAT